MKRYYCPTCKKFKSRLQLHKTDDTRFAYYVCRVCHKSNIYTTEDLLKMLIEKSIPRGELKANKHGSFV